MSDMEYEEGEEVFYGVQQVGDLKTQTERLKKYQVMNHAGGYVFQADYITKLLRFLCMGSEGPTYYCKEKEIKRENIQCLDQLIMNGRGPEAVSVIQDVSLSGRAAKQASTMFALAICCRSDDLKTKEAAYKVLPEVCRIPTHLFQFIKYCEELSAGTGWGRAHRRGVSQWYCKYANKKDGYNRLALQVTKYKKRFEWSHKDVLRLCHLKTNDKAISFIITYLTRGMKWAKEGYKILTPAEREDSSLKSIIEFLEAVEETGKCTDQERMKLLILQHSLTREHVPTELLKSKIVWKALIKHMPMTAMVRNLGKMSSLKLLEPGSPEEALTVSKLTNEQLLESARIHPFQLLVALNQYQKGQGELGKLKWTRNKTVERSLEDAFYRSFKYTPSTNKRFLLAVDVSGSMNTPVLGTPTISARDAAAAMMMVTARTEKIFEIVAFSSGLRKMDIDARDDLDSVLDKCSCLPFSGTDCSAPMHYALENKKKFDVFIVYTDSETYHGRSHPSQALEMYRQASGIKDSRLIVCGMASNGFTIADPADRYMMDIVGFDSNAPEIIYNFVMGVL